MLPHNNAAPITPSRPWSLWGSININSHRVKKDASPLKLVRIVTLTSTTRLTRGAMTSSKSFYASTKNLIHMMNIPVELRKSRLKGVSPSA